MHQEFTERQRQYLAFIHRYTVKHGIAPSFEEIGTHFGTTAPSVNNMIKTLCARDLLTRVPGVARSLRVLVPHRDWAKANSILVGEEHRRPDRLACRPRMQQRPLPLRHSTC